MKTLYLVFSVFLFCFFSTICLGQSCLPNGITFTTQQEIDDFATNYPGCTTIEGDLEIRENVSGAIVNLQGLSPITSIDGSLNIFINDALTSLEGLNQVTTIGGRLFIQYNGLLESLEGLESLSSIGGYFFVGNNASITSLKGLDNLTAIGGYASIQNSASLTSLQGLEQLTSIGAFLDIGRNDQLTSLASLSNLTAINDISIFNNELLTNLRGLEGLDTIGGEMNILSNNALTSLEGLDNLVFIGSDVRIEGNAALVTLSGLEKLNVVGGSMRISNHLLLSHLRGLHNLEEVQEDLNILSNSSLISLEGLEQLRVVGRNFNVGESTILQSLSGLEGLHFIGAGLGIYNNPKLLSLRGLENLISVKTLFYINGNTVLSSLSNLKSLTMIDGSLIIRGNPELSICNEWAICNYILENSSPATIENNAQGCNDESEVLLGCNLSIVNYQLFYDINQNKLRDSGELIYPDAQILLEPDEGFRYVNDDAGGFLFFDQVGDYKISYDNQVTPDWMLTTDSASYQISIGTTLTSDTLYFGLSPTTDDTDLLTTINAPPARCNDWITFDIHSKNLGTTFIDGTLWLEVDENVDGTQFISPPDTMVAPNLYGWYFNDLHPGRTVREEIRLKMPGPLQFQIGDLLHFTSYADFRDENNEYQSDLFEYNTELLCSYDPNDKLVNPQRNNNEVLFGEDLIYTIRFQNTGNDVAYDVVIRDTLDDNLDASTLKVLSTSHPSVLVTRLEADRYLTFSFEDIYLPDSTANLEGSQGYISYMINPKDGLAEQTRIQNTAAIYFDFNPPIITNTTENILTSELTTLYELEGGLSLRLFPNPTSGLIDLQSSGDFEGILEVTDGVGRRILQRRINNSAEVDLGGQRAGVYFIRIQTEKGSFTEKVIKL